MTTADSISGTRLVGEDSRASRASRVWGLVV